LTLRLPAQGPSDAITVVVAHAEVVVLALFSAPRGSDPGGACSRQLHIGSGGGGGGVPTAVRRQDVHVELPSATRPTVSPGRFRPHRLQPRSFISAYAAADVADELRPILSMVPIEPLLPPGARCPLEDLGPSTSGIETTTPA